jgi:dihydroflavonol-4-reductase
MFDGGYDWVDVRDVASSICNALTMGRIGENYLLSGKYYTMKDIVGIVSEVKGRKIRVANVPVWVVKAGLPFVKLQSLITGKAPLYTIESIDILLHGSPMISHEKARNELQHNPRPFQETVADLVEWFKANRYIK